MAARLRAVLPPLCTLLVALLCLGCGERGPIETISPSRGLIRESFREPGRTRLAKTYLITMPVSGRIARIDFEPGDPVKAREPLVTFDAVPFNEAVAEAKAAVAEITANIAVKDANAIENTALIEMKEAVKAAYETLKASDEEIKAEKARSDRAAKELKRVKALADQKTVSESRLDDAQLRAETSLIELRRQQFYRAALNAMVTIVKLGPRYIEQYMDLKKLQRKTLVHQLTQARSRLVRAEHELKLISVLSPVDGMILERYTQGDGAFPAGRRLLLVGNLDQLEAEVDVLTQDALRLNAGSEAVCESALGLAGIPGKVKRIEPAGFTKLSSLGVEQQRVKVIVGFDRKSENLGVGYRLQVRFFTGSKADALKIPRFSVLQAFDRSFYVFKLKGDRLKKTLVEIGLRSDLELEVLRGLGPRDSIAARPDTTMTDGTKVKVKRRK